MEQRDYLLSQIDQLGLFIDKWLSAFKNIENSTQREGAILSFNAELQKKLNLDLSSILMKTEDQLIEAIETNKLSNEMIEKLSDALSSIAYSYLNSIDRNQLNTICLLLYRYINEHDATYSLERDMKIERINHSI